MTITSSAKIAIIGTGAVGSFYGGLLALSGQDVLFFAKPQQVTLLKEKGLTIQWANEQQHVKLNVTSDFDELSSCRHILMCVKTHQNTSLASQIAKHIHPQAVVISLQNGIQNAQTLAQSITQPIYVAMIYAAIEKSEINTVVHHGGGDLILGNPLQIPTSMGHLPRFGKCLETAKIPYSISQDILPTLWNKWIINCAFNGLSALGPIHYGQLIQEPGMHELMNAIAMECFTLAKAEKIVLDEAKILQQIKDIARDCPLQISSMAQDMVKKRPTEILELNGLAQFKGKLHAIATPLNSMICALIQMREKLY